MPVVSTYGFLNWSLQCPAISAASGFFSLRSCIENTLVHVCMSACKRACVPVYFDKSRPRIFIIKQKYGCKDSLHYL